MEEIKNNLQKLYDKHQEIDALEREVKNEVRIHVEEIRELQNGDVVDIYAGKNHMGTGVVVGANVPVWLMPIELEYLIKDSGKDFHKRMGDIYYEVVQMKKDGKPSSKHFGFQRVFRYNSSKEDYTLVKRD